MGVASCRRDGPNGGRPPLGNVKTTGRREFAGPKSSRARRPRLRHGYRLAPRSPFYSMKISDWFRSTTIFSVPKTRGSRIWPTVCSRTCMAT
jgi:hypothetical protein